jgi:ABC-type sugar transport system permease subunit
VIAANIWQMLGFYMIVLLTGLQNIPQNLYEAAAIDGAPRATVSGASRCRCSNPRCSCAS